MQDKKGCGFWFGVILIVIAGIMAIFAINLKEASAWIIPIVVFIAGYMLVRRRNKKANDQNSRNKTLSPEEIQRQNDIEQCFKNIREGKITVDKLIVVDPSVILKPNEELQIVIPNLNLMESRSVRYSTGGYGGPSFRIASGMSFRLGAFGSRSESRDEVKTIDKGILTITNERLIYTGERFSSEIPLSKIVAIDPYSDGIGVTIRGKSKIQYFIGLKEGQYSVNIYHNDKHYKESITGVWIGCIIEGLIKKQQ